MAFVPDESRRKRAAVWMSIAGRRCACRAGRAAILVACASSVGCRARENSPIATRRPALAEVVGKFEIDERLNLCDVHQERDGALAGFVEMPQYRDVLRANGFDVSNVRLLPEESSTGDRFALVSDEHALLRKTPSNEPGDRDNVTDVLRGEWVWILDQHADGATLVHSSDGYLGWLQSSSLIPVAIDTLPEAPVVTATTGPTTIEVPRDAAELKRTQVLRQAKSMSGTRYVWGGKTKDGIDCSGLTQTSFARSGILLPRDADQQANVGQLVATRYSRNGLLPGDLLFFVSPRRGNVSHVAIYMGAGKYVEAAGRDVHVKSMTPGDPDYDEKRTATFGWARRVIE